MENIVIIVILIVTLTLLVKHFWKSTRNPNTACSFCSNCKGNCKLNNNKKKYKELK
jgi:FtsZ-interacting cell division protein ZipA